MRRQVLAWVCVLAVVAVTAPASAIVTINEFIGSTASTDKEFIELYNTGPGSVDISGWSIELWESDIGSTIPSLDGASPYVVPASTTLLAEGYYLMASALTETAYTVTADLLLPSNAIENSSYTMILNDSVGNNILSLFVTDGGAGDYANDNGVAITPDYTFGPDGTYTPAGEYRVGDGGPTWAQLEFEVPAPSATPGYANLPEPGSFVLLAMGGLAMLRRRR